MSEAEQSGTRFLDFVGSESTLRSTDDVLAITLPLLEQVLEVHEAGKVAPLEGVEDLMVTAGRLWFERAKARAARSAESAIERLQRSESLAFEVTGHYKRVAEGHDEATTDLGVTEPGATLTRPGFVTRYVSWEHEIGHHDALTDIYSLGIVMASVALDQNLGDAEALSSFAEKRSNLASWSQRLHPVVARVVVRMTELDRRKRVQDLRGIISALRNYREQRAVPDEPLAPYGGADQLTGRRHLYGRLRDRLVDFSRRNRLLYFSPTGQTVNLTLGSVPLVLNVQSVSPDTLLTWRGRAVADIASTKPVPLGRYLRFEDYPFLSSALDQLRLDANRSKAEVGFSPLRLVVCFLHWHNLKEAKEARITSPLLLLPVTLEKKKGVRDAVFLTAQSERAEVNPVLRQALEQLYDVTLPESVDVSDPNAIATLNAELLRQLNASEPGLSVMHVDKPRIDMILAQAKKRLDAYRKRVSLSGRAARSHRGFDYSYARSKLHPLGIQLFEHLVYPSAAANRDLHDEPHPRIFAHSPEVVEKALYSLKEGGTGGGPYEWAIDSCSVTLANFNYRKMSLVRDYAGLIQSDAPHAMFDALFSERARPVWSEQQAIPVEERFDVMAADPTQASAVARARSGESFIIQGPPGTGKSQTITNLIADYVARGKRVLFVCEKRAAIDVVYHRLRMQGLSPLTCLIHDSQVDKKTFIKDVKETYEAWIQQPQSQALGDSRRAAAAHYGSVLGRATRFRAAMQAVPDGAASPMVSLIARALDLADLPASVVPVERLPRQSALGDGLQLVRSLEQGLRAVGRDSTFSTHPLRALSDEVLFAENVQQAVREESRALLGMLDALSTSQLVRVAAPLTVGDVVARIRFVERLAPLIAEKALRLLDASSDARRAFDAGLEKLADSATLVAKAAAAASGWRAPLAANETRTALVLARRFEGSLAYRLFGWLSPAWWRLRSVLGTSFDFASRTLKPSWTEILDKLAARHDAELASQELAERLRKELGLRDLQSVQLVLSSLPPESPQIAAFRQWLVTPGGRDDAERLAGTAEAARELPARLARLVRVGDEQTPQELRQLVAALEVPLADLPAVLQPLRGLAATEHRALSAVVRKYPVTADQLERDVCRAEADAGLRARALDMLSGVDWDALREQAPISSAELRRTNGEAIVEGKRNAFLAHVQLSMAPGDTLSREQKRQKKEYASGRKELEHELGKVKRYRAIRDLATSNTGLVLRDLKPVWLMSPLSVADTLPLERSFDLVIFDEASQIPLEDAVPAAHRGGQTIVVGDQMQLPPSDFFGASRIETEDGNEDEDFGYELDASSLLSHAERTLPSTMLGWHYRSRDEALIAFSNRVFYENKLLTIPSVFQQRKLPAITVSKAEDGAAGAAAVLERAISFHRLVASPYEQRRNEGEARYIAELLRGILAANTGKTIGVVAFSEAQQSEIDAALRELSQEDPEFGARYEAEQDREEDGQHVGLFVKNLENVQGDERDIIVISVCYGPDANGRMLMNFGPINKTGGEKRLNVIFSRAKHHLAVVSSIRWTAITNEYNDGASCLRNYLRYAEAVSTGSSEEANLALQGYKARDTQPQKSSAGSLEERLARALRERGYEVELGIGASQFRCNLGVRRPGEARYRLGILLDDSAHQSRQVDELLAAQPSVLHAFGWRTLTVLHKDWYADPDHVLQRIEIALRSTGPS